MGAVYQPQPVPPGVVLVRRPAEPPALPALAPGATRWRRRQPRGGRCPCNAGVIPRRPTQPPLFRGGHRVFLRRAPQPPRPGVANAQPRNALRAMRAAQRRPFDARARASSPFGALLRVVPWRAPRLTRWDEVRQCRSNLRRQTATPPQRHVCCSSRTLPTWAHCRQCHRRGTACGYQMPNVRP